MTKQEAINKLVAWCRAQVGYSEGANNWNKYAAYLDPLKITYGNKQSLAWCAEFCLAGFVECFGVDNSLAMLYSPRPTAIPVCKDGAQYFKQHKAFFKTPEVGDVIFFYVGGAINHQGIVVEVGGGVVRTIEGNSSDMVANRAYAVGASNIAGYGRPDWSIVDAPVNDESSNEPAEPQPDTTCSVTVELPIIKYGDEGLAVKVMQTLLIGKGFSCGWYGADGEYGQQTKIGLFQFQQKHGLETDNVCGRATWELLLSF